MFFVTAATAAPDAPGALPSGPPALADAIYGGAPLEALEAEGLLTLTGDRDKARRFTTFFDLPEKVSA